MQKFYQEDEEEKP